jgi:hypothetical protein
MARKIALRNPRAAYRRRVVAARRFAIGTKCMCGESRSEALVPGTKQTICYKCDRKLRKRKTRENHHLFGESNSPFTMSVPVNDHRASLSTAQYDWPRKTLENKNRSTSLAGAAFIRGFTDIVVYLLDEVLIPIAEMLELLDTILEKKLGKKYWKKTKLKAFEPKS